MTDGTGCKVVATLAMVMTLVGCAHQPRVDCEGKLQPINQPAPIQGKETNRPLSNPPGAKQSADTPQPVERADDSGSSNTSSSSGKERSP